MSRWLADLARTADVTFQAPERLWLGLPVLGVLVLVPLAQRVRAGDTLWPLGLRALALAALLAILLEPAVEDGQTRRGRLLVLADVSPSIGAAGLERTQAYLAGAATPFDLVTFGATPTLVGERVDGATLHRDPRAATDLAAAFRFAAVRTHREEPLRIVLLSDGRATEPGAEDAALRLRRAAELWAVAVPDAPATDAPALTARGLVLPPREKRRTPFALKARVDAGAAARVEATLFLDGKPHRTETLELRPGENEVVFPALTLAPGRYFAQALFGPDATPHDNVAAAELEVPGVPRILCLAAAKRKALVAVALRTQGMDVTVAAARGEHDFTEYDAVVLLPDAPTDDLEAHAPALADLVGRRGGGLVAVGGAEGAGLARLHATPLAFLLPLAFEPRAQAQDAPPTPKPADKPRIEVIEEKKEAYPITLGLVVDRSGSMDGKKIRQAQLAAIAAARTLTKEDRILVVAFGDRAQILMTPRSAGDIQAIGRAVAGLYAEGQTAMFHALVVAQEWMQREPSPIRHVLLISDGRPTDGGRWRDVVTNMTREKITVSTVGIGMDVDSHLLGKLAQWGRGKYWLARAHEIPQVVTQDTKRVVAARDRRGKDAERTQPDKEPRPDPEPPPETEKPEAAPPATVPIVAEPGAPRDMLKGMPDEELPEVAGVEEGKPRFASWTAARAGADGPPLLAYWRFGLGTAAALTVDPEASGAKKLREHENFPRLIAQLVRSVLPDTHGAAFVLQQDLRVRGDEESLSLRVLGEDGLPRTDLAIEVALADGTELPVRRRADRYEAGLPRRGEAAVVDVRLGPASAPLLERTLVVPPSGNRELARTGPDRRALLRLVGDPDRLDPPAVDVLAAPVLELARLRPLWLPFLLIAAILLPFDAWARRRSRSASR
ncbi:MAG: vWA domain-containing protein [Planctomycetota bacterium]